jgi:ParB-like chromosome segregation protein Spo0J
MTTGSALITRKQLNPYEEAKAVRAMLDRPLTVDGAAQALGWPKARVTARVKLLELPERGQQLIGDGVIGCAGAIVRLRSAKEGARYVSLDGLARSAGADRGAAFQH